MKIELHKGDLPAGLDFGDSVAVDTETMGLNLHRDRLCVVQLSAGDGTCHLVHYPSGTGYDAPNLKALLSDTGVVKLFHYARFDIASMYQYLGVLCAPVYCTKVASKLVRTNTEKHSLRELCQTLLGIELSKEQQQSDWGSDTLTEEQQRYAAQDVLHLHRLREHLDVLLAREGRADLAADCFAFLPARARLDLGGWEDPDVLSH